MHFNWSTDLLETLNVETITTHQVPVPRLSSFSRNFRLMRVIFRDYKENNLEYSKSVSYTNVCLKKHQE